ncbi:glycosyltransferase [Ramlibacter sp. AN1133]|uniref:glycosyltransferase n=1 Tax=Ramlibacter sp. AN1133 TaxID=3133429 RepID=UPI0030BA3D95
MSQLHANAAAAAGYDAVIMLTWSDWHREPRSNRYHYATRFAREHPVLFLQPTLAADAAPLVEASGCDGLEIVSLPHTLTPALVEQVLALMRQRGIRRPLLWIYSSTHYALLLRALPNAPRVYHATEDYLTPWTHWEEAQYQVAESVRRLVPEIDLVVTVSGQVGNAFLENTTYKGPLLVAPNGCDAGFYRALAPGAPPPREKVCIFQGGINIRMDFELLLQLARRLPDWEFWFCGAADERQEGWRRLKAERNVRWFGPLPPEEFGARMFEATVGLIPFLPEKGIWNSLPLKAYEYVACGLPVVSVPIHALMDQPRLFSIAETADGFARAIVQLAPTRSDPELLRLREEASAGNSYDERFATVRARIVEVIAARRQQPKRLNIAVLYDDGMSLHVSTIREHVDSFVRYSRHDVYYFPATGPAAAFTVRHGGGSSPTEPDFGFFDVLVVHFSVRVSVRGHMTPEMERAMARFPGLKVLFIQDEYETPETARQWMEDVGIDLVYTCVPMESVELVYPRERFPHVDFLPTLTGYVPEDPALDSFALPLAQRRNLIAYRGRRLPLWYGRLGWEKYHIGAEVKRLAAERDLPVDVEVEDGKRIYGDGWYRFLGSARSTLGTESGCNLFDFDGSIRARVARELQQDPTLDYPRLASWLEPLEQGVRMNQISPKVFEAIRTRTALVLFEGQYSGVVRPGVHYIPLKKDFSNFDEVVRVLRDDRQVSELTARAYADVVASGRYSYRTFVEGFDRDVESRLCRGGRVRILGMPLIALARDGSLEHMQPQQESAYLFSSVALDRNTEGAAVMAHARESLARRIALDQAEQELQALRAALADAPPAPEPASVMVAVSSAAPVARGRLRSRLRRLLAGQLEKIQERRLQGTASPLTGVVLGVWRRTPSRAKRLVRAVLHRL